MSYDAINKYEVMWILVAFDIPTETKQQREAATTFRNELLKDGFSMFQYSIYIRNCSSRPNADTHIRRVKKFLPTYGHVCIIKITDMQFSMMELFYSKKKIKTPDSPQQLTLF